MPNYMIYFFKNIQPEIDKGVSHRVIRDKKILSDKILNYLLTESVADMLKLYIDPDATNMQIIQAKEHKYLSFTSEKDLSTLQNDMKEIDQGIIQYIFGIAPEEAKTPVSYRALGMHEFSLKYLRVTDDPIADADIQEILIGMVTEEDVLNAQLRKTRIRDSDLDSEFRNMNI